MGRTSYRGLTWDHPRGRDALIAAARGSGLDLTWDVHPLSGFESTPIEQLAERYDVIVLDHPQLGDAIRHDCLQPLDEVVDADFVGPSVASYRMNGRLWAWPLDAATQVAATRVDLVGEPPRLWSAK
jgi:multiple sugar transport system substrate-binding protein